MDELPEELLDHIISEAVKPLPGRQGAYYHDLLSVCLVSPSRHGFLYRDLLSLSLVSRKFHRLTEPYLYHSVMLSENNERRFLHTTEAHTELSRHTRELFIINSQDIARDVLRLAARLPRMRKLDLDMTSWKLSHLLPVLQLPSIIELRLSGVEARHIAQPSSVDWAITNTSITSLDMSFSRPERWWEHCNELWKFAAVFGGLRSLSAHSDYEVVHTDILSGPVFRCLVDAFKHAFETSLRSFRFGYNDLNHDQAYEGDLDISDAFDAREILKQSHLEHLTIDTMCLHRPRRNDNLRSLDLAPSSLPSSLRTLYLRHVVAIGNLNPTERNLMHSDEAQCLSQLVNLGTRKARFPRLEKMTLAIFLPAFFEDVALRILKVQARKVKLQLELMLM
ncbi:uncharacterized protein yc1106_03638 [Curvularia clavata]|uniref:F-box domain-containing protein n=1 Tax=Curvularia clavata TaxID=95742 RepID=A0A9Q8Z5H2_CURCL|nr:uncharacterized protein yc1106_03638 [Curvularia clavata]